MVKANIPRVDPIKIWVWVEENPSSVFSKGTKILQA
jgi:hypothetical protein